MRVGLCFGSSYSICSVRTGNVCIGFYSLIDIIHGLERNSHAKVNARVYIISLSAVYLIVVLWSLHGHSIGEYKHFVMFVSLMKCLNVSALGSCLGRK